MIEQDYILKILQQFFEAIAKLVRHREDGDGDTAELQARFDEMYELFFKESANHFYQVDKDDIVDELESEGCSERDTFAKAQMLAELLYQDALIKTLIPERCALLEKSFYLFQYLEHGTKTYSWDREIKMRNIRQMLEEYEING